LAFAMFGAFTLQLPSALQTRLSNLSNQQKSGSYAGVLVMGALSALIVTACVAPAIVAALSVIAQSGNVTRGAWALYSTGIGIGAPLLVVGASAGTLLPRVGAWMESVKVLFGFMFLALALYFAQQLLSAEVAMLLWSVLAVMTGFWIFSLKGPSGAPAPAVVRAPGLIALVYGVLLLIGVASGATDPLQPLAGLRAPVQANAFSSSTPATSEAPGSASASSSGEVHTVGSLSFETVASLEELQARVSAAKASGKTVMLDFYADWCTSCKEMEKYTFTDAAVQSALGNTILLRADVTRNNAQDKALLKHFGIFGPPTIAFYDAAGAEKQNFRVVGYMKAGEFAALLKKALETSQST
jgi:thioredoxin:protein disulfide reductase